MLWLLGGLDPTGGAGILRDVWTARALLPGAELGAVVSAWTWQGRGAPARAEARSLGRIAEELAELPQPDAIKVGLVPARLIEAGLVPLLRGLAGPAPIVVDPVLIASDGGDLGARPRELLALAEVAALVTPNYGEAAVLAGVEPDPAVESRLAGRLEELSRRPSAPAWLLKGGHAAGDDVVADHLWERGALRVFRRPRCAGPDPRGTGCALATAIAVGLARRRWEGRGRGFTGPGAERGAPVSDRYAERGGEEGGERETPLVAAVGEAIAWLNRARLRWRPGPDGRAHLPVDGAQG